MGLTGLSVAWRLAHLRYGIPSFFASASGAAALFAFISMALAYAVKWKVAAQSVKAEFYHPIAGSMFGTIFVSLLLVPILIAPMNLLVARLLWTMGAIGIVVLAWVIASRWLSARQELSNATPAWMIPVIGLLNLPLAVPVLAWPAIHSVMVFGLAVGLFFSTPLFTIILLRQVFEPPMSDALKPTLMILVAPSAVGFSAYVVTTGQTDLFAQALYWLTLFILAILIGRLRTLPSCCPFKLSWWAVSFPLAACAIAALRYAAYAPGWVSDGIAIGLLGFVTLVIGGLLVRTIVGLAGGELRTLGSG